MDTASVILQGPRTETGLHNNISVGITYLEAWLGGNGCIPVHNLMEDAATAEIARTQVCGALRAPKRWQLWINSGGLF